MIRKLLDWLKKSKGFLTKRGSFLNYAEVHAIGLGIMDGAGLNGQGYRLEYWRKKHPDVNEDTVHYYEKGYFWARLVKYLGTAAILLYLYGLKALKALFPLPA